MGIEEALCNWKCGTRLLLWPGTDKDSLLVFVGLIAELLTEVVESVQHLIVARLTDSLLCIYRFIDSQSLDTDHHTLEAFLIFGALYIAFKYFVML